MNPVLPDEAVEFGAAAARAFAALGGVGAARRAEDAPARLAAELENADVIAAEDTRRVRRLAATLGVRLTGRVVSYYDVIEARRAAELGGDDRVERAVAERDRGPGARFEVELEPLDHRDEPAERDQRGGGRAPGAEPPRPLSCAPAVGSSAR